MVENSIRPKLLNRILKRNVRIRHVLNHWLNIRELIKQIELKTNNRDGIDNISKNNSWLKCSGDIKMEKPLWPAVIGISNDNKLDWIVWENNRSIRRWTRNNRPVG